MIGCIFSVGSQEWKDLICGRREEEEKEQRILKEVLWKMSVKIHMLRMMKMAAFLPGGGEIEIWCVFVDVQRGWVLGGVMQVLLSATM